MCRPTLSFAPMKTYDPISIYLRDKLKKERKFSLSPPTLSAEKMASSFDFHSFYFFISFSFPLFLFLFFLFSLFIYFSCFIFFIIFSTLYLDQYESFIQVHHMSCHVSLDTRYLEKSEISIVLKSDKIRRGN